MATRVTRFPAHKDHANPAQIIQAKYFTLTGRIKNKKTKRAPGMLQRLSILIKQVEPEGQPKGPHRRGDKQEGDQPPEFALTDRVRIERQMGDKVTLRLGQQVNDAGGGHDEERELRNHPLTKPPLQTVQEAHDGSL